MALGLIYVKITGPYWNLVTAGDITYLELYQHIQKLDEYIGNICKKKQQNCLQLLMTCLGMWRSILIMLKNDFISK